MPETIKRNVPRDVFLHLFAMVALYWSAISFITLCWQYVDYFFPDILNYTYNNAGAIRFAVSSLIIIFPLFILASWFLNRIYAKESAVRESKIRKWLIYLTLFVASLIIIGDLIFIINNFLGGATTVSFVLKSLSILVVAAVVFGYYLDDVRRQITAASTKYVAILTSIVILVMVVGAFFIVGTPMQARLAQFDQQRVADLQGIQSQIINYWQSKGQLPPNLSSLNNSISGYIVPTDPQTGKPYEYAVTSATTVSFELCATFNLKSSVENGNAAPAPAAYPGGTSQDWSYPAGHFCFDRTIDPQLYPITK